MSLLNNILADKIIAYDVTRIISYVLLAIMAVCALFVIVVVLIQQGQSSGLGALGGTTETFYGKNKGKSIESKLKKATTACLIIMAIIAIAYFVFTVWLGSFGS